MDEFDDVGPCVIMASPGMMQSGLSRELFEAWCTDKKNGVIIAVIIQKMIITAKIKIFPLRAIVLRELWQK